MTLPGGRFETVREGWMGGRMLFSAPGRGATLSQFREAGFANVRTRTVTDPLGSDAEFAFADFGGERPASSRRQNRFPPVAERPNMSEISPDTLLPTERMRDRALADEVTQTHRGHAYAEAGDTFEIDGEGFEVVAVDDRTLGDLTDEDARAEGARDLEHYRQILERAHEHFEWDDEVDIVRHRFERVE